MVATAPSMIPQHHVILTCLALVTSLISATFQLYSSNKCVDLYLHIVFFPALPPSLFCLCFVLPVSISFVSYAVSFYSILVGYFCLLDCFILLFMKVATIFIFTCLQKKSLIFSSIKSLVFLHPTLLLTYW